jgi:hypothetical protein
MGATIDFLNISFGPDAVICDGLLFAKTYGCTKLQSNSITSNHSGGIFGSISKKLDQLFIG